MASSSEPPRQPMHPLKFLALVLLALALATATAAAGVVIYGRDTLWADLFGPPDLGPYDFDKPTRTGKLNDALFCPAASEACFQASVDRNTPVFAVDAATLYAAVRDRILANTGAEIVDEQSERGLLRAVVRTPLLRFPDTLSVRVRQDGPGHATLWLYSRSQVGHTDLGANERRLKRLLRDLRRALPVVPPPA